MNQPILKQVNDFFESSEERVYSKGDIITFANQEPEGVMFLQEGVVEQYDVTPEGNKVSVNLFKIGSFFPMSWAINKTPNEYFYAALTEVRLRRAHPDKVADFLRQNPEVMFDLMSRVYRGTDGLLRRLVLAASGIAANRLIFELLIEASRFGDGINSGSHVVIKVKQSNLAARSGLARETVSRELHKLENEGYLKLTKAGISLDVKKLQEKLDVHV